MRNHRGMHHHCNGGGHGTGLVAQALHPQGIAGKVVAGMKRLLAQEREYIARFDATADDAVIGSNIPDVVAALAKLWGPSQDVRGEWHSWNIPKGQVRLPRPRPKARPKDPARVAQGKAWRARQLAVAKKEAITAPPAGINARDNAVK
jgi:hypothetical protein